MTHFSWGLVKIRGALHSCIEVGKHPRPVVPGHALNVSRCPEIPVLLVEAYPAPDYPAALAARRRAAVAEQYRMWRLAGAR